MDENTSQNPLSPPSWRTLFVQNKILQNLNIFKVVWCLTFITVLDVRDFVVRFPDSGDFQNPRICNGLGQKGFCHFPVSEQDI